MMSDRFRFRAWIQYDDARRMIYFNLFSLDGGVYVGLGHFIEEETEPAMQCTGLTDRNGILIYEGDVVRDLAAPRRYIYGNRPEIVNATYVIKWHLAQYVGRGIGPNALECLHLTELYGESAEVIGNIYENPELINEGPACDLDHHERGPRQNPK